MADPSPSIYESITDVDRNQWNNVVEQSDLGSVFHRYEWLALVEDTLDADPCHIVAACDGNPVAMFPNFRTPVYVPGWSTVSSSLPVRELVSVDPGFGGPVVTGSEDAYLDALFDALGDLGGVGTLHHTVRTNDLGYVRYGKAFAKHGYRPLSVNCRFRIHLERDWSDVRADMDADRRRALRQMADRDVSYRDVPLDDDELRVTYEAYCRNVERAGGDPFPYSFFRGLVDRLADRVKVFAVSVDGREVGRYLYVLDDEQSTVHYYFAAIGDEDYFEDHPSELLHAHGIQWGQNHDYRFYDFGGTGADYRDGVFRHKDGYGGEAVPTCQWQRGVSRVGWPAYRVARSIYRKTAY